MKYFTAVTEEHLLMRDMDRAAIEALAAAVKRPRTPLPYRPQLIEAAILTAADPVFIAGNGPNVSPDTAEKERRAQPHRAYWC